MERPSGYHKQQSRNPVIRGPAKTLSTVLHCSSAEYIKYLQARMAGKFPIMCYPEFVPRSTDLSDWIKALKTSQDFPFPRIPGPVGVTIGCYALFMHNYELRYGRAARQFFTESIEDPDYVDRVSDSQKMDLRYEISQDPTYLEQLPEYEYCPFSADVLFPWEKEVPYDVLEYSINGTPLPINEAMYASFKEHLSRMVDEHLCDYYPPDRLDWMSYLTDHKIWAGSKTTCLEARLEDVSMDMPVVLNFYRMSVQKDAEEVRDAVGGDVATINLVKYLDFCGRQMFKKWPRDLMSAKSLDSEISRLFRKAKGRDDRPCLVMTDIKKCGLTFPHRLLSDFGDMLAERTGDRTFRLLRLFETANYHDSDGTFLGTAKQGFFLGMANRYASAIIAAIFDWWHLEGEDGRFFNDDESLMLHSPARAQEWWDTLTSLGIWVNRSKSVISRGELKMVMCENYFGMVKNLSDRKIHNIFRIPVTSSWAEAARTTWCAYCYDIQRQSDIINRHGGRTSPDHDAWAMNEVLHLINPSLERLALPSAWGGYRLGDPEDAIEAGIPNDELDYAIWQSRQEWTTPGYRYRKSLSDRIGFTLETDLVFEQRIDQWRPIIDGISRREAKKKTWQSFAKKMWREMHARHSYDSSVRNSFLSTYEQRWVVRWSLCRKLPTPKRSPLGLTRWGCKAGVVRFQGDDIEPSRLQPWAGYGNYAIDWEDYQIAFRQYSRFAPDPESAIYGYISQWGAFPIFDTPEAEVDVPGFWVTLGAVSMRWCQSIRNEEDIIYAFQYNAPDLFESEVARRIAGWEPEPTAQDCVREADLTGLPPIIDWDTFTLDPAPDPDTTSVIEVVADDIYQDLLDDLLVGDLDLDDDDRPLVMDYEVTDWNDMSIIIVEEGDPRWVPPPVGFGLDSECDSEWSSSSDSEQSESDSDSAR